MHKFKSLKSRVFYRLLTSKPLDYRLGFFKGGSHRMLVSEGRKFITFAWHDDAEISGHLIKKLLIERALLTEEEAYKLVHKIK